MTKILKTREPLYFQIISQVSEKSLVFFKELLKFSKIVLEVWFDHNLRSKPTLTYNTVDFKGIVQEVVSNSLKLYGISYVYTALNRSVAHGLFFA